MKKRGLAAQVPKLVTFAHRCSATMARLLAGATWSKGGFGLPSHAVGC